MIRLLLDYLRMATNLRRRLSRAERHSAIACAAGRDDFELATLNIMISRFYYDFALMTNARHAAKIFSFIVTSPNTDDDVFICQPSLFTRKANGHDDYRCLTLTFHSSCLTIYLAPA